MFRVTACRFLKISVTASLLCVAGLLVLPGAFWSSEASAQSAAKYKYTGAASCGASNCHGSLKPKPEYPKLNENIIWFQKDKHAKGYATLINEDLESGVSPSKMAKNLKIDKAETSSRCLVCHAVDVPKELRGPKFDIAEGVHCDGCHGPGEKWLEPHAEKDWTHEKSLALGMYDTKNLLLRAKKCVSCHLAIDRDMVDAGHPDLLAFELDTFSAEEPPHWRNQGTWFASRVWATGQVIALRDSLKQLADRAKDAKTSADLLAEAWEKARGHAILFRHALGQISAAARASLDQDVASLNQLLGKPGGDRSKIAAAASKQAKALDQIAAQVANTKKLAKAGTQKLIKDIAGDASISTAGMSAVEQTAMALDRLYLNWSNAPGNEEEGAVLDALDKIFDDLDDPDKFDAKIFAAHLKEFQSSFK